MPKEKKVRTSGPASAVARTVDMFSGHTQAEEAAVAAEVITETYKGSETIEQAAERWRNNAMFTAEHLSKRWPDNVPNTDKFRITQKGDKLFLEKFSLGPNGVSGAPPTAYHWSGVMFSEDSLYELTNVFVKAAKAKQARVSGQRPEGPPKEPKDSP